MNLTELSTSELARRRDDLRGEYEALQAQGLTLDLTRGKPSAEQLDLSEPLLELPGAGKHVASDGADTRNYGGLHGLVELREIFSELLGVPVEQLLAFGNSSLELMHECLVHAVLFGVPGSAQPWGMGTGTALLCPVPGYDRHFSLCEKLRIEMITVPMNAAGPYMDEVERLVEADAMIKGIWCVPKYSNPSGIRYAEQTVGRLARMRTAAPDFRIFWDNAYVVHHLTEVRHEVAYILQLANDAGHANR
ncbi:MAG: aminotransferase class I/II-fold pyridoxal phosphate-dependent enzyme, partial [Pseudonocardiaceae bacterium]